MVDTGGGGAPLPARNGEGSLGERTRTRFESAIGQGATSRFDPGSSVKEDGMMRTSDDTGTLMSARRVRLAAGRDIARAVAQSRRRGAPLPLSSFAVGS